MGKDFVVYLAGRIANLSYDEAIKERDELTKKLNDAGIKCRTPMRGKQHLSGKVITSDVFKNGLTTQEVIARDLNDVKKCDAVVILTGDCASWGTAGEFYYATWVVHKPTLVIATNHVGGWMEYYATRIVPNFDSAVTVLLHWKKYWNGEGVYDTR
jgi:nucleoside 2-deoxyribosyltransferase